MKKNIIKVATILSLFILFPLIAQAFSVDIDYIYYNDNSGRIIDWNFNGLSNNDFEYNHPSNVPNVDIPEASCTFPQGENAFFPWGGGNEFKDNNSFDVGLDGQHYNISVNNDELYIGINGYQGALNAGPATEWTYEAKFTNFENIRNQGNFAHIIGIASDSWDNEVLVAYLNVIYVNGTVGGKKYKNALVFSMEIENSNSGNDDPVFESGGPCSSKKSAHLFSNFNLSTATIYLKTNVSNNGRTLKGYYKINNDASWTLIASHTLSANKLYGIGPADNSENYTFPAVDFEDIVFTKDPCKNVGDSNSNGCIVNKLKTVAKLSKSYFKNYSMGLKKKAYSIDTYQEKAWHKFITKWEKLEIKAAAKKEDCETSADTVIEDIVAIAIDDIYTQISDEIDTDDKNGAKSASSLLKAAEKLASSLLKAQAANIKKPDATKLQKAIVKAEAKFATSWEKALKKAQKKGIDYNSLSADDIETATDTMVSDILDNM